MSMKNFCLKSKNNRSMPARDLSTPSTTPHTAFSPTPEHRRHNIVWKILLICILAVSGWYLYETMERMESNNPEPRAIESYNRMMFSNGAGIDVMGNRIDSVFTSKTDETVIFVAAFLLRYDSLDGDLKFWNEVNSHLSEHDNIRLTAYCENDRCIEAVRNNPDMARFPVLEYGGVIDMQAVIGADATGEFWLRGNRAVRIIWRDEPITPSDVIKSMEDWGNEGKPD